MFRSAICLTVLMMMGTPVAAQIYSDQDPPIIVNCGAQIGSVVKVMPGDLPLSITKTEFAPLPFAYAIVRVPPGTSQCIKVAFNGQGFCGAYSCTIAATIDRNGMFGGEGLEGDLRFGGGVRQWVRRVGAGTHRIQIHIEVLEFDPPNLYESLNLKSWVLDVSNFR